MTKQFEKLEEVLDLPPMTTEVIEPTQEDLQEALARAKELENTVSKIDGFEKHDEEMDELAGMAIQAHKDLQDLGMNIEIRHAGEIFSSSSQMLKIAVDAKNLKVEKKLRLLRLELDKMRIDKMSKAEDNSIEGTATKIDRTELLKMLKEMPPKE
jgi:RNase P/RNase MRP subunit p29